MGLFRCAAEYNTRELEFKKIRRACILRLKGLQNVVKHNHYGQELRILLFQTVQAFNAVKEFFEPYLHDEVAQEYETVNDIKSLQAEIKIIKQDKNKLEKEVDELNVKNNRQHKKLESVQERCAQLEEQLKVQTQLHDELKYCISDYQKENDFLKGQHNENKNQEHAWLQKPFSELFALDDTHQQNCVLQKQYNELRDEMNAMKKKGSDTQKQLEEVLTKYHTTTEHVQNLQNELEDKNAIIEKLEFKNCVMAFQNPNDTWLEKQKLLDENLQKPFDTNFIINSNSLNKHQTVAHFEVPIQESPQLKASLTKMHECDDNQVEIDTAEEISQNSTDLDKLTQKLRVLENELNFAQNHCYNLEKSNLDLKIKNEELRSKKGLTQISLIENLQNRIHSHQEIITLLHIANKNLEEKPQAAVNLPPAFPDVFEKSNQTIDTDSYQLEVIQYIEEINSEIKNADVYIQKFDADTESQEYERMEELLTQCLFKLDNIDSRDIPIIRFQRRKAMKSAQYVLDRLGFICFM